ncbi:MAG: sulfatase-like hydrolase/transferase [Candidatus Latescibacteria bacterium]|nr:sulfatase-like hydrolase/transferase [Candidatus Latescibacterota bacterium]
MSADRPNIIFISAEQQRGDTVHACGAEWMRTPHLDALAGESVVFDRAFCPAATCVSSRAAFYTGLYPHNNGIYGFQPSSGSLHWLPRLAEQGYHCVSIGKTHLPPTGFHEHLAEHDNKCALKIRGEDCDWIRAVRAAGYEPPFDLHDTDPDFYDKLGAIVWPLPEDLHPDIYMANRALEWLDAWDGRAPLYLHLGFLSPHDLYDPPQRFLDLYDDDDIPMPHVTAEERAGIPEALFAQHRRLEAAHGITVVKPSRATPERVRRMRKHYYASVTMIDEKIGQLVDKLKEKGLYDDAVVIYTSDHGDHLFDHDLIYKGELYDTIVRVPLMVKAPGVTPQVRREELVSQMDVVQYILDMSGADGEGLHGLSLRRALDDGHEHPRRYVFAEEGETGLRPEPDLLTMIRSRTHKLIHFSGNRSGQLFDLVADPGETRNLWGDTAYREIQAELTADLLDWLSTDLHRRRDLFAEAR